jgi:rhodanese-related sulfurtransferase
VVQVPAQEVKQRLAGQQPPLVVDVRNPSETSVEGVIEGALLIPLNDLPARERELPRDREVVCVCRSGARSTNAANFLRQKGVNASSLAGGMIAWVGAALPVKR